ncbi:MAG: prepilin-type N-terminal cleavage/methylation domain-containing protein [Chthoniobacteraceae bacterium]
MSHQSVPNPKPGIAFSRGFTLVEMLVSITVLVIIVVLVSQLTGAATKTVTGSRKHIDADTQARLVFNRMAIDFSNMIQRPDLDYSLFKQPSGTLPPNYGSTAIGANLQAGGSAPVNDQLAFYAKGAGFYSGTTPPPLSTKAAMTLVGYNMAADPYLNRSALQRMSLGLGWEPVNGFPNIAYLPAMISNQFSNPFTTTSYWDTVGDQVFRFEYTYLLKPNLTNPAVSYSSRLSNTPYWDANTNKMSPTIPHTCINGFQDVAAIVVCIAVLDSTSNVILANGNTSLANALPDAAEGADIASTWIPIVTSGTFAKSAGIPQEAASSVRIYERYFYLQPPQ